MRAFVEPYTYDSTGLATSWAARIWDTDNDPAQDFLAGRSYQGVVMLRRESVDSVVAGPLHGAIDRQAARDIRRAMRLSGISRGGYFRGGRGIPFSKGASN